MKEKTAAEQKNVERLTAHWRLMSPLQRAFMTELGRTEVSDTGFTVALVLMRVLDTRTYKAFSVFAAAQESGLSLPQLRCATAELVDLGALDVRKRAFLGRRMTLYRMGQAIASRAVVFAELATHAETGHGAGEP